MRVDYTPLFAEKAAKPSRARRPRRSVRATVLRLAMFLAGTALALVLPFVVLVRASVLVHQRWALSSWPSLAVGAVTTLVLLLLYVLVLRVRVRRKLGVPKHVRRALAVVVAGYVGFTLVYLSASNAKTVELRSAYSSLNPLLRVATSTVLLVDRDAVVTDLGRTREDYLSWGLPVREASLHFEQPTGFVHAVDLRTIGRPEWKNRALEVYYRAMGFGTLRHVGTADHLHVSLPLSVAPGA